MNRLFVFALLLLSFNSFTQKVPYLDQEIQADGQLNEAVWQQIEPFGLFSDYFPDDDGLAANQTKVRAFHNGQTLFISAVYEDTTAETKVGTLKRDQHFRGVVLSDCFGVVIDPSNQKNQGYNFIVNAENVQLEGLVSFEGDDYIKNDSWNATWFSGAKVEGTNKIYEMAIPLKYLSFQSDQNTWGLTFFTRDFKTQKWMALSNGLTSLNIQFDLRYTLPYQIENLPTTSASKFTLTPSLTATTTKDEVQDIDDQNLKPSLDLQYNITSSLKLDATINPDFSQVDVDAPVTNLTRFSVFFPERRNFFLENSDLFNSLGVEGVSPFYSRRVGSQTDMITGVKLSGNVAKQSRVGLLTAQTKKEDDIASQNYAVLVGQQQVSDKITATGYLVNRQETDGLSFQDDYNRVTGINLNFKTDDAKWSGQAGYSQSFSDNTQGDNQFYNIQGRYLTKKTNLQLSYRGVQKNYLTDAGFNPRIYNYDAITDQTIRQGYQRIGAHLQQFSFPEEPKKVERYRWINLRSEAYINQQGDLAEFDASWGHSIWMRKNRDALYIYPGYRFDNLQYGFDLLQNGNPITPGKYNMPYVFGGYNNAASNKNLFYQTRFEIGKFYNGNRYEAQAFLGYRFMPTGLVTVDYKPTHIDLGDLGSDTFHLINANTEIYFSNRLNWSTYAQLNPQRENINLNTRLQWEYKPLSYLYVVFTDNLTEQFDQKNWGVAVKANWRLDL